jgi:hypothetical protein
MPVRTRSTLIVRSALAAVIAAGTVVAVSGAAVAGSAAGLVSGQVLDRGAPVSGAVVTLTAWPNIATLSALPDDAAVATQVVATATTSTDGSYALTPDLAALSAGYREPDGTVNLELDATTNAAEQVYNISAADSSSATAAAHVGTAVASARPETVTFDLGRQTVADSLSAAPNQTASVPTDTFAATASGGPTKIPVPPPPCEGYQASTWYYQRQETFLDVYADAGAHGTVTLTSESSHTLGIGFDFDAAGWRASGSLTMETDTSSASSLTYAGGYQLSNEVNYRKFTEVCPGRDTRYEVRPEGFYAEQVPRLRVNVGGEYWTNCEKYFAGAEFVKDRGSNFDFTTGMHAPFVDVSAQASFSHNTEITFVVTSPQLLCGSTKQGPGSAPEAGMRPASDPGY